MLVASGNAQPSLRGMATAVLTTIRNCQARGNSGVSAAPAQQVLCLHGVGILELQPHECPLKSGLSAGEDVLCLVSFLRRGGYWPAR